MWIHFVIYSFICCKRPLSRRCLDVWFADCDKQLKCTLINYCVKCAIFIIITNLIVLLLSIGAKCYLLVIYKQLMWLFIVYKKNIKILAIDRITEVLFLSAVDVIVTAFQLTFLTDPVTSLGFIMMISTLQSTALIDHYYRTHTNIYLDYLSSCWTFY